MYQLRLAIKSGDLGIVQTLFDERVAKYLLQQINCWKIEEIIIKLKNPVNIDKLSKVGTELICFTLRPWHYVVSRMGNYGTCTVNDCCMLTDRVRRFRIVWIGGAITTL